MIFDGHSDLLYDVTRRRLAGEKHVLERRHLRNLEAGGVEGLMLALWVSADSFWKKVPEATDHRARTEIMLLCMKAELAECPWLTMVRTPAEAEDTKAAGKKYAFLAVEGMDAMGDDLGAIDRYGDLGVRIGMLTWNGENLLATGAGGDPYSGLTELGRRAVRRMEDRNILVDVSHLNDGGFRDVMKMAEGPVIASHSNCRALCDVRRNLTDDQLRAIRDTGGIVGLNVHHAFVHTDRERQTAEMLARHAAHMAEVMGVEHVACGFDFCEYFGPGNEGVDGLENCSQIGNLFYWLEKLGMNEQERNMIARENFLRVLA
ncbi:membrane dipeptidase [Oscillibacter valericigenes]|uniref:dipeptidase n=1 Tax=Oscillibacter valericigenes TaxID=351091 RepID=UPI001F44FF80|nr:membrane dipeptidase [Oscillibacter valericigenes]MCF2664284.1 membrane dipeptidase [Oscillibacter valericigenes]